MTHCSLLSHSSFSSLINFSPPHQGVGVCVSATTVTVIACDRYFTIVYQENHQSSRSRARIRTANQQSSSLNRSNYAQVLIETIIIWIIGIICGLPVSVFQVVITFPQYSDNYIQCIEDWPKTLKSAYSVSILIVQCVLPSVALVLTGQAITSHLNRVAGLLSSTSASNHTNHASHHVHPNNVTNAGNSSSMTTGAGINMTTIIVTAASPSTNEYDEGGSQNYAESQLNGCDSGTTQSQVPQSGRHRATSVPLTLSSSSSTNTTPVTATTTVPSTTMTAAADCHQRNLERNNSVTRTLLAVSISFTVCWMPLHILNALIDLGLVTHERYFSEQQIYLMIAICSSIAMTSVPLNALLYGWYNPSINREVISWRLIANASICNFTTDIASRRNSGNNNNNNLSIGAEGRIRAASDAGAGSTCGGDRV